MITTMYTKEQGKKMKNARMGRIRMTKTRASLWHARLKWAGVGDTGNLSEDYQLVLRAVRVTEGTYHRP